MDPVLQGQPEIIQQGGHNIDVLGQLAASFTSVTTPWQVHHQRDMSHFIPGMPVVLSRDVMFAQHMTMVGREDDEGIFVTVLALHLVKQLPKPRIHHRQGSCILPLQVMGSSTVPIHLVISAPIVMGSIPVIVIKIQIFLWAVKRLVRVKHLHPKKVIILAFVRFEPIDSALECLRRGVIGGSFESRLVLSILCPPLA